MYSGLDGGSVSFTLRRRFGPLAHLVWISERTLVSRNACKDMVLWLCVFPNLFPIPFRSDILHTR